MFKKTHFNERLKRV